MKYRLILASASPQRRKLLKKLRVPFTVVPSRVREDNPARVHHKEAVDLVVRLAVRKARAIAKQFKDQNCMVLGADTLVVCKGQIFGKPRNAKHARAMLSDLSGSWQSVLTGLCVITTPEGAARTDWAETKLKFATLPAQTIAELAARNLDKSGAYAVQSIHDHHIVEMRGDLDNVIGLPLKNVRKLLRWAGKTTTVPQKRRAKSP